MSRISTCYELVLVLSASQQGKKHCYLLVLLAALGCCVSRLSAAVPCAVLPAHHSAFIDWYTDQLDKLSPLFGKAGPLLHHRTRVHKGCKVVGNVAYVVNLCM